MKGLIVPVLDLVGHSFCHHGSALLLWREDTGSVGMNDLIYKTWHGLEFADPSC